VALALLAAERFSDSWFVDLAGDGPAALGAAEPAGPGIGDWLAAPESIGRDAIARLVVPIGNLGVVPLGERSGAVTERWHTLADTLAAGHRRSVVDAGIGPPPDPLRERASADLLVVRGCYLSLRRAAALRRPPTGVVLVNEPRRVLRRPDVERAVGVPVVGEVDWDPDVARAVDSGLLSQRLPRSLRSGLKGIPWAS
jgi:hypothetical protein